MARIKAPVPLNLITTDFQKLTRTPSHIQTAETDTNKHASSSQIWGVLYDSCMKSCGNIAIVRFTQNPQISVCDVRVRRLLNEHATNLRSSLPASTVGHVTWLRGNQKTPLYYSQIGGNFQKAPHKICWVVADGNDTCNCNTRTCKSPRARDIRDTQYSWLRFISSFA